MKNPSAITAWGTIERKRDQSYVTFIDRADDAAGSSALTGFIDELLKLL